MNIKRLLGYFVLFLGLVLLGHYFFLQGPFLTRMAWNDDFFITSNIFSERGFLAFLPGIYRPLHWMGHPLGYPFVVHSLDLLFGNVLLSARLYSLLSWLGVFVLLLFLVLKKEITSASFVLISLVVVFSGHILSVATGANADLPLAFWGLLGLFLIYLRRWSWGVFALSVAVLTRESGLAFVAASGVWLFDDKEQKSFKKYYLFIPALLLGVHFLYSFFMDGSWSVHPYATKTLRHIKVDFFNLSGSKLDSFTRFIEMLSADFPLWFWVCGLAMQVLGLIWITEKRKKLLLSLVIVQVLFVFFFVFYEDHLSRDFAPAMLFFFVGSFFALENLLKKLKVADMALMTLAGAFCLGLIPYEKAWLQTEQVAPENRSWFGHPDQIEFLKQVGKRLDRVKEELPHRKLFYSANILLQKQFTQSVFGFVEYPLKASFDGSEDHVNVMLIFSPNLNFYYDQPQLEQMALDRGFKLWDEVHAGSYSVKIYLHTKLLKLMVR